MSSVQLSIIVSSALLNHCLFTTQQAFRKLKETQKNRKYHTVIKLLNIEDFLVDFFTLRLVERQPVGM